MSKKVLLIAVNEQLVKSFKTCLNKFGYIIEHIDNPKIAAGSTVQFAPDIILCETILPVVSGMDLARLFKSHKKVAKIPFILLSLDVPSEDEMARADLTIHADDIIPLPINQRDLLKEISKWIDPKKRPPTISRRISGFLKADPAKKAKKAKSWKKGKINITSVTRLLYNIFDGRETGVIIIKGERRILKASIKDGALVDIVSNFSRLDTLGRYLIQIKKITRAQHERSFSLAKREGIFQGQALVKMKIISGNEMDIFVARHKMAKLHRVFEGRWEKTSFHFNQNIALDMAGAFSPIPVNDILNQGILSVAPLNSLFKVFVRNKKDDVPIKLRTNFNQVVSTLELDDILIKAAKSLDSLSMTNIKSATRKNHEILVRLSFLLIVTRGARFKETYPLKQKSKVKSEREKAQPGQEITSSGTSTFFGWDSGLFKKAIASGRKHVENNSWIKASEDFHEAMKRNPESSEAITLNAWADYRVRGVKNLAIAHRCKEDLKKAITFDEDNDMAYLYLGKILKAEGKEKMAESHFRKAYTINPTNDEAKREVTLARIKNRKNRGFGYRR